MVLRADLHRDPAPDTFALCMRWILRARKPTVNEASVNERRAKCRARENRRSGAMCDSAYRKQSYSRSKEGIPPVSFSPRYKDKIRVATKTCTRVQRRFTLR